MPAQFPPHRRKETLFPSGTVAEETEPLAARAVGRAKENIITSASIKMPSRVDLLDMLMVILTP